MTSKVVKCPNCNIVINEVLAFVCNKVDVMDEVSIVQICTSAFSESDILNAKNLLFDSLPTSRRKKIRKRQGKSRRDIEDIICVIKETDPEEIPVFVARELHKLPPVLFDHVDVTRLLKDIVRIQCELKVIKDQYVSTSQLEELKNDLESLKKTSVVNNFTGNINTRRGACLLSSFTCDSGPMGLHPVQDINNTSPELQTPPQHQNQLVYRPVMGTNNLSEGSRTQISPIQIQAVSETAVREQIEQVNCTEAMTHAQPCSARTSEHTVAKAGSGSKISTQRSLADITRDGVWNQPVPDEKWITVQRRRLRNRFAGNRGNATAGPDQKFRAADVNIPIYIYNVSKEVSVCDIMKYIENKVNITVALEKMVMKVSKSYDAYKIYVPSHKVDIFLKDDFWPDGIAYRRFINFGGRKNYSNILAVEKNISKV